MALAKERIPQDCHMGLIQACSFYENVYGGTSVQVSDSSSIRCFGYKAMIETEEGLEKTNGSAKNFSFPDPSSVNGSGFVFGTKNSPATEAQSVINFNSGYDNRVYSGGSLLSFDQGDCSILADSMDHNYHWNQLNIECGTDSRPSEELNCLETASNYGSMNNTFKDDYHVEDQFGWFYSETVTDGVHQSEGQEASFYKRPHMGGEMQAPKKLCIGAPRKPKPKSVPSKDPQSIAAKNRRERISERLKILQELVPNGAKVDLVTMLEKAISYVKFLQLQVKVLATDEFWPMQGGKAPEVAQVKEAIDAILSSHVDRNSSSK